MAEGRTLQLALTGAVSVKYQRTDQPIAPIYLTDSFQYTDHNVFLANGSEPNQANELYHGRRIFTPPGPELIDLDSELLNQWGDILDFFKIRFILIRNRADELDVVLNNNHFLSYAFKNEAGYISPGGCRIISEPSYPTGLQGSSGSSGGDLGNLSINAGVAIEYDLIIAGCSTDINVSSGI